MNTGAVSMRYAKALLSYAKAEGQEEKVYGEMKQLAAHYLSVEGLRRAIATPVLNPPAKHELLCEAAGGKQLSPQTSRFFELVLQARREKLLLFMAYAYIDLYRDDKNILVGKLTTAVASEKLVKHLEQLASERTKGSVELEAVVDPKLIGGYIIELSGYRLDASVANQLKRVRQQFVARNRRIV